MGHIGRAVARRAAAFGMEIVNSSRRDSRPEALSLPVGLDELLETSSLPVGLDELLETSDVVSVHCPLTSQTRHLIDAVALEHMKPSAFLINTARGAVVDEAALAQALSTGTIAGAGLDVYENEPDVHPGLRTLDNVVLAPHLGSATVETRARMAELAADNVVAVLCGRDAITPVSVP
ncbi:NAD(P)-dependent oxidoreductase [[Kitasatospora] papulosa]|uniref:NAD(P)-dependent oxidoreductase n=1 Tax=[Kitasatospora] papulosa TaxID=1464011 RepID=UPI0038019F04